MPRLANITLEGNLIRTWKDLDYLTPRKGKVSQIKEIMLVGNPLRENEIQHGRHEKYKRWEYLFACIGGTIEHLNSFQRGVSTVPNVVGARPGARRQDRV